ncbi:MAG: AMP-binding protein [Hahellaceae bacterium]|nr:AMP-binding protein [Hahellaceae bacterium]
MLTVPKELKNFLELYLYRAEHQPDDTAYIFLEDGEHKEVRLTFGELHRQAMLIAREIQQHAPLGERVILLYQPGLEFIVAFTACIYAGVIAVPVYPPQGPRDWPRFVKIAQDSGARLICCSDLVFKPFVSAQKMTPAIASIPCVATDGLIRSAGSDLMSEAAFALPVLNREDVVFLQYTSGSTGDPKGVMVTHGNLLHNQHVNVTGYQHGDDLVVVSWLPQYHDMGLIGNILLVPYTGRPLVLMSPMAFLQKPLRWLQAITRYKATASGAPNFAYELCLRTIKDEDLAALDLSSWDFAYNGAEFIRTTTLEKFYQRFKACGLKKSALCPIYGLAESTLIVTSADKHTLYKSLHVDAEQIHHNRVQPLAEDLPGGRWLTGCGYVLDQEVRIVNPDTFHECDDLRVGEIWVRGPSVCKGYWGRPDATRELFEAQIVSDNPSSEASDALTPGLLHSGYLRTGDLGFLHEGELYLTGRHKEIVVLDGRNLYPQDIEDLIQKDRPALRKGCGAAFAIDVDDAEHLVVVQEMARAATLDEAGFEVMARSIRADVAEVYGVNLYALVLIKQGTFLKTSSGKIRRRAMREKYLQNKLDVMFSTTDPRLSAPAGSTVSATQVRPALAETHGKSLVRARTRLEKLLLSLVSNRAGLAETQLDVRRPLNDYGLDSKTLVGLSGEINEALQLNLAPRILYDYPSISALAGYLATLIEKGEPASAAVAVSGTPRDDVQEPIAIIGMSCRFPGGVSSPEAFWALLNEGRDAIGEIPPSRPGSALFNAAASKGALDAGSMLGGYLQNVDGFDPEFFNISPREARFMDPQQRLLLEVVWEAWEHAAVVPSQLAGSATGVFVGISNNDYDRLRAGSDAPHDAYTGTGNAFSIAANRLSYVFDLQGPSLAIDTACSSSLVALHQACQSIRQGESSQAVVAGVNLILTPDLTQTFAQARMMAADGRCKTFDDHADGYVRGEGCGALILKPLSAALRDGNPVLALVKGSGVNQDGRSNGLTAPNGPSQSQVIRQALAAAQVAAAEVSYVEAHGTGTPLGDPIEIQALHEVYGVARGTSAESTSDKLWVGSVKTNIGHLEAAAGIAGVMKVVLAMQHQRIPAHLNYSTPNQLIPWTEVAVTVNDRARDWPENAKMPRLAGVSAFGFGGTNAHVILASAPEPDLPSDSEGASSSETGAVCDQQQAKLFCLSAPSKVALQARIEALRQYLASHPDVALDKLCFSLNAGREHFSHRIAIIAESAQALSEKLELTVSGSPANLPSGVIGPANPSSGRLPRYAFLFTGQGAQYVQMGRDLYRHQAMFRESLDQCDALLKAQCNLSVLEVLLSDDPEVAAEIHHTGYTQPLLFCLEYALARLWQHWGIEPDILLGHSVGEYALACLAGVFSLEDGLRLIAARGRLTQALEEPGSMMAVFAHLDDVSGVISDYQDISVAAVNGPGQIVLAGRSSTLLAVAELFSQQHIEVRNLKVSHGFHSPLMQPMLAEFREVAATVSYHPSQLDIISSVTGQRIDDQMSHPDYWCQHILAPVMFADAIALLHREGVDICLEIGPSSTLCAMGRRCIDDPGVVWYSSLKQGQNDCEHLMSTVASLYVSGARFDWAGWSSRPPQALSDLPSYPFQRKPYWMEAGTRLPASQVSAEISSGQAGHVAEHYLLGRRLYSPRLGRDEMQFEVHLTQQSPHFVKEFFDGESVILRWPTLLTMVLHVGQLVYREAVEQARQLGGRKLLAQVPARQSVLFSVRDMDITLDLTLGPQQACVLHTWVERRAGNELSVRCYTPEGDDSLNGAGEWQLVSVASLARIDAARCPAGDVLTGLKQRIERAMNPAEYYENCRDRGLYYSAFPNLLIDELFVSDHDALAHVRLGQDQAWDLTQRIPAAFVHACFQVLGVLCYEDSDETFVPYRVGLVEFFDIPQSSGWVHVQRIAQWDDEERHLDIDVTWIGENHRVVMRVSGMKLKAAKVVKRGLKEQLAVLPENRRQRLLQDFLRRIVSKALSIDSDSLDKSRALMEYGMDSLVAMEILGRIRFALDVELSIVKLQDGVNLLSLSDMVDARLSSLPSASPAADDLVSPLVIIQKGDVGRLPLILVHPIGGSVFCYHDLALALGTSQPVYALQAHAFIDEESAPDSLDEIVSDYLYEVRRVQPHGPYLLGGWSLGALLLWKWLSA